MQKSCQLKRLNVESCTESNCEGCSWLVTIEELEKAEIVQQKFRKEIADRNALGYRITDFSSTAKKMKYERKIK